MPTLEEFRYLVEADMLATRGNSLDRLKVLINHLNIARLEVPVDRQRTESVEIAIAFYILGRFEADGSFAPAGHVVLPWCRQVVRLASAGEESVSTGCASDSGPLVSIDMLIDEPIKGEGHRKLYNAVQRWWEESVDCKRGALKFALPWPECARIVSLPPGAFSARLSVLRPEHHDEHNGLPDRLRAVVNRVLLARANSSSGLGVVVGVGVGASAPAADSISGSMDRTRDVVAELASVALRSPAQPLGRCRDERCPRRSGKCECTELSQGLCSLWQDLRCLALPTPGELAADEVLFMLRNAAPQDGQRQPESRIQTVRYEWFPSQLIALEDRFKERFEGKADDLVGELGTCANDVLASLRGDAESKDAVYEALLFVMCGAELTRDERNHRLLVLKALWSGFSVEGLRETTSAWGIQVDSVWGRCRDQLEGGRFPLDLALSNSTMDSGATEVVVGWAGDSRVGAMRLCGERQAGPGSRYPARLLLAEKIALSPSFNRGVLFVPWTAPIAGPETTGEFSAFGLAMIACGDNRTDVTRAALVAKNFGGVIHTALLNWQQQRLFDVHDERGVEGVDKVQGAILDVLSLSGRVADSRDDSNGDGGGTRLEFSLYGRATPFVVQFQAGARPAEFHQYYAKMLAGVGRAGEEAGFQVMQSILGHEGARVAAGAGSWLDLLASGSASPTQHQTARWMLQSSLDYWVLYADPGAQAFASSHFPRLWHEGGPSEVAAWVSDVTSFAWRVFLRKRLAREFDSRALANVPEAGGLLAELTEGAPALVDVRNEPNVRFVERRLSGLGTLDRATEFEASLVRWVVAALENAFKHTRPQRPEDEESQRDVAGELLWLRSWQSQHTGEPIAFEIRCDSSGSQVAVSNSINGVSDREQARYGGTRLTLDVVARHMKGTLSKWGREDDRFVAEMALPLRRLVRGY